VGLVGVLALAGCSGIPSKPGSLPAGAKWAGVGEDAVFVQISHISGLDWKVDVWDRKGRSLASGTFQLRGFARSRIYPDEVLGWKNGALQLKDGTWLVPAPAQPAKP
jgi:hypothetical protein